MLIMSGDLFNLMKLEIGDTIEITDNFDGLFLPGTRFKVINTQYFELAKSGKTYKRLRKLYINEKTKRWCNVLYNKRNASFPKVANKMQRR